LETTAGLLPATVDVFKINASTGVIQGVSVLGDQDGDEDHEGNVRDQSLGSLLEDKPAEAVHHPAEGLDFTQLHSQHDSEASARVSYTSTASSARQRPRVRIALGPSSSQEFVADLQLQPGDRLGVELAAKRGKSAALQVTAVMDVGAVPRWNENNPDKMVCRDCSILQVNEHRIDRIRPDEASSLFRTLPRHMRLLVRRPDAL